MKKKRRSNPKHKSGAPRITPAQAPQRSRRDVLRWGRNGLIGAAVLGGAGFFSVTSVRATMAEHDLERLGQGRPAIVQIHDPQCALCTALQRETRAAMCSFEDQAFDYLVANIRTAEGSAFATRFGVAHVTLLLFDGTGSLIEVLQGSRDRDELEVIFARHLKAHG